MRKKTIQIFCDMCKKEFKYSEYVLSKSLIIEIKSDQSSISRCDSSCKDVCDGCWGELRLFIESRKQQGE